MSRQLDQTAGDLTLHTGRAGAASKVGHDLTIRVGQWTATEDGGAVRVTMALSSLEVLRGDGGLKPLSDKDKATIVSNAVDALQVNKHPEAVFTATVGELPEGESSVTGDFTIAGATHPLTLQVLVHPDRVQVHGELVQTQFGIKPYSGLLGALKLRDMVEIKADLRLG